MVELSGFISILRSFASVEISKAFSNPTSDRPQITEAVHDHSAIYSNFGSLPERLLERRLATSVAHSLSSLTAPSDKPTLSDTGMALRAALLPLVEARAAHASGAALASSSATQQTSVPTPDTVLPIGVVTKGRDPVVSHNTGHNLSTHSFDRHRSALAPTLLQSASKSALLPDALRDVTATGDPRLSNSAPTTQSVATSANLSMDKGPFVRQVELADIAHAAMVLMTTDGSGRAMSNGVIFNAAMLPGWPYPSSVARDLSTLKDPQGAKQFFAAIDDNKPMSDAELVKYLGELGFGLAFMNRLRKLARSLEGVDKKTVFTFLASLIAAVEEVAQGFLEAVALQEEAEKGATAIKAGAEQNAHFGGPRRSRLQI